VAHVCPGCAPGSLKQQGQAGTAAGSSCAR
jgi:hypothetical protein